MSPEEIENINVLSPNGLKTLRKRLGLKQAEAASALGVSSNAYCKKEMGLRSISRADTLAMLYLESLADRETLFGVSDALQAACVAVERYASNAKLRALSPKGGAA